MPDIQPLLDLGIDPECPSGKDILEEFSDACKKGDQPVVEAFLRAGLWSVDELQVYRPSSYDGPPLHRACEGGSLAVVQALVKAGFDIEIRDKDDDTPMMTANNHKRPGVAEWLAAQGANPNPVNNRGYSAAAVAARSKDQRLLKALAAQGASLDTGRFPAIEVAHESPEIVKLLLDLGANPDVASSFGLPVLHALCLIPAASASAQLLVEKGADAGPARDGLDAWFCTKWRGSKVKGLKATGDNKARLAWLTAARDGGELPKPPGGDVDVPGPTGETALLLAVTRKDWAMATELLRRGANPLRHGTRTVKLADTFDALTRIASQRWDENRALRAAKEPVPDVDSGERAAFTRALPDAIRAGGPGRPGGWPSDLRCAALPIAVRIPDTALLLELLDLGAPLWSKDTYNYVPFDLLVTASDPEALPGALSAMERRGDLARLGAEMAADPDLVVGRWDGEPEVRTTLALLGAAVCKAADAGRPAAVKQLLAALPPGFKRPMSLDGYPVWNRMTPDRTAVMEPYQDVIRELLSAGIDLGSWGRQAAEFGSLGVDTFVGGNGRPALDKVLLEWVCNEPLYAAWAKVSGVARDALPVDDPEAVGRAEADDAVWAELARSIAGVDGAAYHCAWARAGMTARIRGAARAGVPLEPQQPRSWTPLRFAARAGQVEVLRALAELGADLDRAGYWGSTALHTAISEGTLDALKTLLALGARTDGPSGYRLLPAAAKRGTEFVTALIDAGARADRPRAGNTLLHASRDPELIARLAAAGGLRARNREGQTPLHAAGGRRPGRRPARPGRQPEPAGPQRSQAAQHGVRARVRGHRGGVRAAGGAPGAARVPGRGDLVRRPPGRAEPA